MAREMTEVPPMPKTVPTDMKIKEGKIILQKDADELREEKGQSVDEVFREVFRCLENV